MPAGVTPIAADYEDIGLGDGRRAVHFKVDTAELMDEIIERHHLIKAPCTYAEQRYPLEDWQTKPTPDEIECFVHVAYREGKSETIDHTITLYTNKDHTEGLFKIVYC
jgi:hypothetical protein